MQIQSDYSRRSNIERQLLKTINFGLGEGCGKNELLNVSW